MAERADPEIQQNIATRTKELFDLLQMKQTEVAEAVGLSTKQLGRMIKNQAMPKVTLLYRLHDLACNKAWVLPDFLGPALEPYPDYAISRAATQFLNAPWPEWLDADPSFQKYGKSGSYTKSVWDDRGEAPFRFSEAMHTLLERFPPKEGRFKAENTDGNIWRFYGGTEEEKRHLVFPEDASDDVEYHRSRREWSRSGLDIPLTLRFDPAGFHSLRDQVREAGLAIYPLIPDSRLVGQPKDFDPKEAIREHFAGRMKEFKERMGVQWKELAAVCDVAKAHRWGIGEIVPSTVNLYKLHKFARAEAGLATNFFDVRLEPDPTYTTRKAVEFLKQEAFDLGSDPTMVAYQRMPVGIYEGLRELARRFPAENGTFEIIGPEEEPYYERTGTKVEAGIHLDAAGLESQLHAAESLDTFTWHAGGADRTPSTAIEFVSRSISHMDIDRVRVWSKVLSR